jgi:hypothetical protein
MSWHDAATRANTGTSNHLFINSPLFTLIQVSSAAPTAAGIGRVAGRRYSFCPVRKRDRTVRSCLYL